MPRHVRALLTAILLVPLAWIGMGLVHWLQGSKLLIPVLVAWAALMIAVLIYAILQAQHSRRERSQ
jgi:energy-converting hydrogenase Eha subunit E